MLNTLFCFINQKQNKNLKTLLITVVQHMTDVAVSEFSHLPESQVLVYFIIALAIQTWTSAAMEFHFIFSKSLVFLGGGRDSSV